MPRTFDVLVVGAGAAGLMAAHFAVERGRSVLITEKNRGPGVKILISGGGRCNLTTTVTDRDLEAAYGRVGGRWLRHALRAFTPADLMRLVENAGVPLQAEELEKVFPVSGKARDVLAALLELARGAELNCGRAVTDLRRVGDGFEAETPAGAIRARAVVLASGGRSYPKTGTTGDGYGLAAALGHTVTATVPALAPLRVDAPWVGDLAGVTLPDVELRVVDETGRELVRRRRPLLFTHRGLSGPGPMDVSGAIEWADEPCVLAIDLLPALPAEELDRALRAEPGRAGAAQLLPAELPLRLREQLVQLAAAEGRAAELSREARQRLVSLCKSLRLDVAGSLGFGKAEVTRGGIPLDEVDARTMASKRAPGLFICGELLDVDGPIGGYNFQAAFATGRLAGMNA